jgi:hypothetical protein
MSAKRSRSSSPSSLPHKKAVNGDALGAPPSPSQQPHLLSLPTDVLRIILSFVARSPTSHVTAQFVCRRFRALAALPSSRKAHHPRVFCTHAAREGYLNLIKWARANGCPWDKSPCALARGGHLEVLQWARANGCPWGEWICAYAALGGHLEVLQWLRANRCPWDETTCTAAAGGGHLAVLQWARANGCPWNERTCEWAARGGHLETLQWAISNGCTYNRTICDLTNVKTWLSAGVLHL